MNHFRKMIGYLYSYIAAGWFWLNGWKVLSKLQRLREKKYRDIQPPLVRDFMEVTDRISEFRWESDFKRWIDSISYVGRIIETKKGDCDDFALFSALAVRRSIEEGYWAPPFREEFARGIYDTKILAFAYQDDHSGSLGGHAVALYKYRDYDGNEGLAWSDYNYPSHGFETIDELLNDTVIRAVFGKPLAYVVIDPVTLDREEWGRLS